MKARGRKTNFFQNAYSSKNALSQFKFGDTSKVMIQAQGEWHGFIRLTFQIGYKLLKGRNCFNFMMVSLAPGIVLKA